MKEFSFLKNGEIDLEKALDFIEENILDDFEYADMSWIVYVGDGDKGYDQSIDYCPKCAEKEIEKLVNTGEYAEGELIVVTDPGNECDGCENCEVCGIDLACSGLGTYLSDYISPCFNDGCDKGALFKIIQTRGFLEDNEPEVKELLTKFFTTGECKKMINDKVKK